jgi:hypothetical protein
MSLLLANIFVDQTRLKSKPALLNQMPNADIP